MKFFEEAWLFWVIEIILLIFIVAVYFIDIWYKNHLKKQKQNDGNTFVGFDTVVKRFFATKENKD